MKGPCHCQLVLIHHLILILLTKVVLVMNSYSAGGPIRSIQCRPAAGPSAPPPNVLFFPPVRPLVAGRTEGQQPPHLELRLELETKVHPQVYNHEEGLLEPSLG